MFFVVFFFVFVFLLLLFFFFFLFFFFCNSVLATQLISTETDQLITSTVLSLCCISYNRMFLC